MNSSIQCADVDPQQSEQMERSGLGTGSGGGKSSPLLPVNRAAFTWRQRYFMAVACGPASKTV